MNFDLENTRRDLIAKRNAAGADTPIGHRCSNLVELLDNFHREGEPAVKGGLLQLIEKQMADLAELTK